MVERLPSSISAWDNKRYSETPFVQEGGKFTVVRAIKDLPPSILERIPELENSPDGFVIKKYKLEGKEVFDSLFGQNDYSYFLGKAKPSHPEHKINPRRFIEAVRILESRQQMLVDYAGKDADLILKSQFMVDVDENGEPAVYEIQRKLNNGLTLGKASIDMYWGGKERRRKEWKGYKKLVANMAHLKDLLLKVDKESTHPYLKFAVPDWHIDNIYLNPQTGEVCIFDNNFFYDRAEDSDSWGPSTKFAAELASKYT